MTKKEKCLIIEKRDYIDGNVYTELEENINVHKYGAHIFHTNNKEVWEYINQFADFNRYTTFLLLILKEIIQFTYYILSNVGC